MGYYYQKKNERVIQSNSEGFEKKLDVRSHAVLNVIPELLSGLGQVDDLVNQGLDAHHIFLADGGTHGGVAGENDALSDILLEQVGQEVQLQVVAVSNDANGAAEGEVVGDDLDEFREVVSVPLAGAHGVNVQILIEIVEESFCF